MNIGAIITIILVVAWVVKGIASAMGSEPQGGKQRPARSLEDWDEMQTQRREQRSGQQAMSQMRADSTAQDPSQMTMAERIELARQRARQQAGVQSQGDDQAEAVRRARAQAEQKAQQQRQAAQQRSQRERAAQQQRAQRQQDERLKQQRRRQAQSQAQAEQQAKRQHRTKPQRRSQQPKRAPVVATGSQRESVVAQSVQRVHQGHGHAGPTVTKLSKSSKASGGATALGSMDRSALRQAFIMKELLDKPVALRDPQADLLS